MGFQTAYLPKPKATARPPMPVVPYERVGRTPPPKPEPVNVTPAPRPISVEELVARFRPVPTPQGDFEDIPTTRQSARRIINVTARAAGFTYNDILGPTRNKKIVAARHAAIIAVHEAHPQLSLPALGRLFCKDHTTIHAALRKAGRR